MKRLLGIALAAVLAGCATAPVAENSSPEPELPQLTDPNPFANYGTGMASDKAHPMAYEWQSANDAEIAKATEPGRLVGIVESDLLTKELLAKVTTLDGTDPMAATQIAAISQLAMCQKCEKAPELRKKWVKALLDAIREERGNDYRRIFFLDQLRWCGRAEDAALIRTSCIPIGRSLLTRNRKAAGATGLPVSDFADMVARELEAAK